MANNDSASQLPPPLSAGEAIAAETDRRVVRWAAVLGVSAMALIGVALLYLLTVTSSNREQYELSYTRLFALNLAIAAGLGVLILWFAVRLTLRLRQKKFGSQLLLKLALIFGLVGVVPGLLIYVVSYQFVARSIESWFDVKVEKALGAGLDLGRSALDVLTLELSNKTRRAAAAMGEQSDVMAALSVDRLRDQLSVDEVVLWSPTGQLVVSSSSTSLDLNAQRLSTQTLRQIKAQKLITSVENFDEAAGRDVSSKALIKVMALTGGSGFSLGSEPRILQTVHYLSPALVANANAVAVANSEYHERALAREGLRRMYIGTLTLALFLAVLGSVLLAIVLGAQLARPLLVLAEGMQQVAQGNLQPKRVLEGKDELDGLTRSFAVMTQQIMEAQAALVRSSQEVSQERGKLQTILDNLSAGVLVIDEQGVVLSANPAATNILRISHEQLAGCDFASVINQPEFIKVVNQQFLDSAVRSSAAASVHWQTPAMLQWGGAQSGEIANRHEVHLIVRGAVLMDAENKSLKLLVFDDITEVVSAQRSLAWGEVARRLAHEIKNPLTPIQLSAQRLERRLSGKLSEGDEAVLHKSVSTIVNQVDAMKNLVNEFRDYARLPVAQLAPENLNRIVSDVCQLYGEEQALLNHNTVGIRLDCDAQCPLIQCDAGQLRQVVHNLLQNAQDACGQAPNASIEVRTLYLSDIYSVRLSVTDNGPGFADNVLARAAEPYVTTKATGTGLGLAVVKKIAEEHRAKLEVSNRVEDGVIIGAQVSLTFPTQVVADETQ